ncbi:MAG: PAS domain S-box protein [Chloroflexi bacterium]|nr:PAS domain S-box protein [Chloroflexota bacterium]
MPLPYLIYVILFAPDLIPRAVVQTAVGELMNFVLLWMLRRGWVQIAATIQALAFWLFMTITAFTAFGVQDESYLFGYPLVVLIAGLLIGPRAAFVMVGLSLFAGLAMVYAELNGMIDNTTYRSSVLTWVISLALFPVIAIVQYLTSRVVTQALNRAKQSEEKYRLISRVSSDYAFESRINSDGVAETVWLAGAFEKMTGYSPEEYIAAGGWYGHIHPDDLEKDALDMDLLQKKQQVLGSEVRTFTKSGEIRWERIFAHPIWNEKENRLVGIVGAVQDITEKKEAEKKLQDTLNQQEAILNNIPDMAWLKDQESRYIAVNEQFLRVCGRNLEDILGKTDMDIWDEKYARMYRMDDIEVMQTGVRKTTEELQRNFSGFEYWVETTKTPIRDEQGRIIGTSGIARDISERKKIEQLDQQRRMMLEKVITLGKQVTEAGNLETVLNKIWNGIRYDLGFDRLGIFLFNPEANTMDSILGTDRQGNKQDTRGHSFLMNETSTFRLVLEKPDGLYYTSAYDEEHHIPPGHEMYGVKEYAAVGVWAGKKPVASIVVDQLLTQQKISAHQLEALRLFAGYAGLAIENARLHAALQKELGARQGFIIELENKNTELERFTYTVSHDLKSPLVTITGFLGYLEKAARSGKMENFERDMNRIRQAVEKMQTLLNDLLELSRIGRLVNEPVNIAFGDLVREAIALLDGPIKSARVAIDFTDEGHVIQGDHVRLLEVMQNLLENAVKFMGKQENPLIQIGSQKDEQGMVIFYVRDNGIGIEPKYQSRIFGLFNKLESSTEGSGIGLTLVKRIIEVHNGKIWLESKPGKGSTFYFTIPGY